MHPPRRETFGWDARTSARLAFPALIVANLALSFGPWMVRHADVGPIASAFWRLAIAAPLLLMLARTVRPPSARPSRGIAMAFVIAGLFFAADLAAWHIGILRTKLANATLFANITSFFFALYGFAIARIWPNRMQWAALALALAGVMLLLGRSYELSPRNLGGDMICLAAGLLYTGYLIAMERVRGSVAPLPALAWATLAGVPLLGGLALATGGAFWPQDWTPLLLLALGSQLVGQGLIVFAMGHLPPIVVGLALLLQPVVSATIGWTVYGETLGLIDIIGAVAIAAALVLVRRKERQTAGGI